MIRFYGWQAMKHVLPSIPGKLEVTQNIACALNSNFTLGIYNDLQQELVKWAKGNYS